MLWLGWFAYCVGVAPTWCFVFVGTRSRGFWRAWFVASGAAIGWPVFWLQYRRWQRHRTWMDDVDDYLRDVTP